MERYVHIWMDGTAGLQCEGLVMKASFEQRRIFVNWSPKVLWPSLSPTRSPDVLLFPHYITFYFGFLSTFSLSPSLPLSLSFSLSFCPLWMTEPRGLRLFGGKLYVRALKGAVCNSVWKEDLKFWPGSAIAIACYSNQTGKCGWQCSLCLSYVYTSTKLELVDCMIPHTLSIFPPPFSIFWCLRQPA